MERRSLGAQWSSAIRPDHPALQELLQFAEKHWNEIRAARESLFIRLCRNKWNK